ncbi:unnamed protein product, partial [Rotaria sp. Silwood2]
MNNGYTKISTINQYWIWLENSFPSNIHCQQWYNDESHHNLNGFKHVLCYITLTQSFHFIMGDASAGPVRTGKIEATKDLRRALG